MTNRMALVKSGLVAGMIALSLAACAPGDEPADPTTTQQTTAPEETTTAPETTEPENRVVDLPASGELNGRRVTVEEFGTTTLSFAEPDPGNEAIYIKVTVENVDADPWPSNVFQFFLVDETGEEWAPELLGSEAGDQLPDVELAVGETSTGYVAFQVPEGSSLTLSYAVNLAEGETIEIPVR